MRGGWGAFSIAARGASHSHMFDPRPWVLSFLYTVALFFSVPLSLAVWYIRRELIQETTVAGDDQVSSCSAFFVLIPITTDQVELISFNVSL
ncbi:hypothetical protein Q1695_000559 [Nippostrongylus brasiliensis]|nr:hypothetical protein Q1695_000559 [Nippostrongylus brasiliensis]